MKAVKREKKEKGDVRAWSQAMLLVHCTTAPPFQVVARHRAGPFFLLTDTDVAIAGTSLSLYSKE
eukprot:1307139-Rhodomonas_salina.8